MMDSKIDAQNEPFYIYRGVGKCFSKGISLFTDNFKFFFRYLWPISLVCALIFTILNQLQLFPYDIALSEHEQFKTYYSIVVTLLYVAVYCVYLSYVYALIKLHVSTYDLSTLSYKFVIAESMQNMKSLFALYALFILLAALTSVLFPLIAVALLPVLPCLMLSGKRFWKALLSGFCLGGRYYFRCLSMALLLLFTVGIILFLIVSPLIVFYMIDLSENMELSMGVSVDTPYIYYYIVPAGTLAITFLSLFISVAFYTSVAYLYASLQVAYEEKLTSLGRD